MASIKVGMRIDEDRRDVQIIISIVNGPRGENKGVGKSIFVGVRDYS